MVFDHILSYKQIYDTTKRINRWVKAGIIHKLFQELHVQGIAESSMLIRLLDSMIVPVHPDACGTLKNGEQAIGHSKGGLTTKIHMMAANASKAVDFFLSAGQQHDAPQGRILMEMVDKQKTVTPLLMDKTYEDDYTRYIAQMLKSDPVVPPKSNRVDPWLYGKELYKRRSEIERLFRLIQGFRRVFCRFGKLDIMYTGFIQLALIYVAIK